MRLSLPGAWLGVMSFVAAFPLPAATQAEDELPPKLAFITALQRAVREDDKTWLAGHLHYPVHYYGAKTTLIRNEAWFLKHYGSVVGDKLKAAVLAQDPYQVLDNWQGVMVGEGGRNIWFNDFGTDDTQPKYEIIAINDSD